MSLDELEVRRGHSRARPSNLNSTSCLIMPLQPLGRHIL